MVAIATAVVAIILVPVRCVTYATCCCRSRVLCTNVNGRDSSKTEAEHRESIIKLALEDLISRDNPSGELTLRRCSLVTLLMDSLAGRSSRRPEIVGWKSKQKSDIYIYLKIGLDLRIA